VISPCIIQITLLRKTAARCGYDTFAITSTAPVELWSGGLESIHLILVRKVQEEESPVGLNKSEPAKEIHSTLA
jgi:hypothetical protein